MTSRVESTPGQTSDVPLGWWRPKAPRRLSELTHALAERALRGENGRSMAKATFALVEAEVAGLAPDLRYAQATKLVAERAPLRVLPGERIVGSATLLEAPAHQTPVAGVGSTSHTTIGFARGLKIGYRGLREQIAERLARGGLDEKGTDLLRAMSLCLEAAAIWHRRHLELLEELAQGSAGEEREGYLRVCEALREAPEEPPETFHEAVQSLWFMFAFQRLMGNWSGIGRIDEMVGPYLARDLAEGRTTLDEAREVLAHFWIKGCEWIGAFSGRGSGDAQHYQNVVLAGVNAEGEEVTNEVTYLVLDIVEELHISDFPVAVRISARTPLRLLRRIAEVQRHGGGIVAVYNEEVVIEGLVRFGYPVEEARCFANDGCWEVIIPGKTTFCYVPFDMLALLHDALGLHDASAPPEFTDFERLYAAFRERLREQVRSHHAAADQWATSGHPAPLLSLLVEDCIERGRGYHDRGSHYNVAAPHAGGMANVANSLLAVKTLVYDERRLTLPELVGILRADWDGQEDLRRFIVNRFEFYGNDNDDADAMMARVFNDYTELVGAVRERGGVLRPAGISTFGREIEWSGPNGGRQASPDGHRRGAVLATNFSPSPGTDKLGPTAVVKSYCKMDFTRTPNGATIELKIHPESVKGEDGLEAMVGLMRSFVQLGGLYLQIDVVSSEMLRDAQQHPERYPNLSVRISGWSARFATLSQEWQDMIIERTEQVLAR
jgi:formate C-acetyltransferase